MAYWKIVIIKEYIGELAFVCVCVGGVRVYETKGLSLWVLPFTA